MTDREMLELAAKAAGYKWRGFSAFGKPLLDEDPKTSPPRLRVPTEWNPLTDDGDAMRLAAALKIDLDWQSTKPMGHPWVEAYRSESDEGGYFCASEPEKNYRRAITRVAAEIGKEIQETTS